MLDIQKRALDSLEGTDFGGLRKRNNFGVDASSDIENAYNNAMLKKTLDLLEDYGFIFLIIKLKIL